MNKKLTILVSLFFIMSYSQVGIGTSSPKPSAILDVTSDDKGVLFPRITTVQANNIASPEEGLMVYNTNLKCLYIHKGSNVWSCISTGEASFNFSQAIIDVGDLTKGTATKGTVNIPISNVSYTGLVTVTAITTQGISGEANTSITTTDTQIPNFPWAYDGGGGPFTKALTQVDVSLVSSSGTGSSALRYCITDGAFADGSNANNAPRSCKVIKDNFPASPDGVYWIDADGCGVMAPQQVQCDMTTDGGGWTLVSNYTRTKGNGTRSQRTTFPRISGALGANEAGDAISWGNVNTSIIGAMEFAEIRYFSIGGHKGALFHIKTAFLANITALKTGASLILGGPNNNFTNLPDHSNENNIPAKFTLADGPAITLGLADYHTVVCGGATAYVWSNSFRTQSNQTFSSNSYRQNSVPFCGGNFIRHDDASILRTWVR